jgi:hypothetical protein
VSGNRRNGLSRRSLLAASGVGLAGLAASEAMGAGESAPIAFDEEADVVVCGGGGAGLSSAMFAKWQGLDVVVLEKAGSVGGTAAKAAFWYWVPNNPAMRAKGLHDGRGDFLRLLARITDPDSYDPGAPRYGMTEWHHAMAAAFYDSGADAVQLLADKGVLPYRHLADVPDYWAELPENKAPKGRILVPEGSNEVNSDGGRVAIRNLLGAARREGVRVRISHRVEELLRDPSGRVIGVVAERGDGTRHRVRARKGVLFASGGFTHSREFRETYLGLPIMGGCAALSNEGDILRVTSGHGVQLANMRNAWLAPISLDKAAARDGSLISTFAMNGDSMIIANKYGRRVTDEKQPYNELTKSFGVWDGARSEHSNLALIVLWDQRAQDKFASPYFGSLIVPPDADDRHVIRGDSLEALASGIEARLERYRELVSTRLAPEFLPSLKATIERFNEMARAGKDKDFGRGERAFGLFLNGPAREPGQPNPCMWPIAASGPYYAALIVAGTLDTKGGPKTDPDGRILDVADRPIPGLYGVGNCVGAGSNAAYWSGGGTLGPILTFAYRAAQAITQDNRSGINHGARS